MHQATYPVFILNLYEPKLAEAGVSLGDIFTSLSLPIGLLNNNQTNIAQETLEHIVDFIVTFNTQIDWSNVVASSVYDNESKFSDWVELVLSEVEYCQPTLEDLSKLLFLSTRSLTRYLSQEGTDFRQLAVKIRMKRAYDSLTNSDASIKKISEILGYKTYRSFSAAFHKYYGDCPHKYRLAQVN